MKSKLDLPFTQQQRGQPHLWFCQAGWRIPDLRIRRNARSFITLWHNGETTCFKKKHPTTKKLLSGKMILIYLDFHPGPPDLFWKIYRKYKNVPKHLDDWMFWQLGMFCNLKRRWNADPWNFRNLRSMIQGRRAQGCTVSHGEPRWAVDSTARRWQARQSAAPTLLAPLAPGIALRLPNCAWVSWIGQRWAAMLWCCELVKPCKTSLRF